MLIITLFLLIAILIAVVCITMIFKKTKKIIQIISGIVLFIDILIVIFTGIKIYQLNKRHMSFDEIMEYNNRVQDVNIMLK